MTNDEARKILAACRPDGEDASDPLIARALAAVQNDAELMRWFADEQEFDRQFGAALADTPVPQDLETRLLAPAARNIIPLPSPWIRRIGLAAAAAVVALLVFFSSWHGPLQPAVSLADFRSEMVGFVKLPPPLELETSHLARIEGWLEKERAPVPAFIPRGLSSLAPIGCRILTFRRREVTLICFQRSRGRLAHLLVVDSALLPGLSSIEKPAFAQEGEWMTAAWQKGNRTYLLAAQGDRELLESYLRESSPNSAR